ncbi:MAG: PIG-L family deacetylase [Actinomycetota bacterium]|nr:PIG-L family deacetylase [Actinomycetota bacterium]
MGTLVSFHAHPDDESIATAGTMALAASQGHRVVLVVATRGELGEPVPGVLAEGEQLGVRRSAETHASADVLGAQRVEFLGYVDSGMMGEPTNDPPYCFWQADVEHAAHRLAAILEEEQPDVLTIYDDNGGYGHPDHIQVHRVGRRAAELTGVPMVVQSTMNRSAMRRWAAEARARAETFDGPDIAEDDDNFGKSESEITHSVDASSELTTKRRAMQSHPSQMSAEHFLLAMPDEAFAVGLGTEWYILDDVSTGEDAGPLAELFTPMR